MVTDAETDTLFLADCLPQKYPRFYDRLNHLLNHQRIAYQFLPGTQDVWALDYMPIQIQPHQFIRFAYAPSYLIGAKALASRSNTDQICRTLKIDTHPSNIIIDGGNVIHGRQRVIMTTRIFTDNPSFSRTALIDALTTLLAVNELIIIPEQPHDITGHADGMVRFIDANTVLINRYPNPKDAFVQTLKRTLRKAGLKLIELTHMPALNHSNDQTLGVYINYLQMKHALLVPTYGQAEDEEALKELEQLFPQQRLLPIDCQEVARQGRSINGIGWNIKRA